MPQLRRHKAANSEHATIGHGDVIDTCKRVSAAANRLGVGLPSSRLSPRALRKQIRARHAEHVRLGGVSALPTLDRLTSKPLIDILRLLSLANATLRRHAPVLKPSGRIL